MTEFTETTIGPVRIICADCMDVLPTLGMVDITVSSPPYNMIPVVKPSGMHAEHKMKRCNAYESHSDDMLQEEYEKWIRDVFGACMSICRGLVWINHKTKFVNKTGRHPLRFFPWNFHSEVVWSRQGSTVLNANRYAPSHEFVYGFGVPHYWDRCNDMKMTVWTIAPVNNIPDHPCPYPVEIPKRCIESSCPPNGIALDPFAGSGTTGVAAIQTGRQAILIEKEPKYYEICIKRCRQAWQIKKSELPFEHEPKMTQRELAIDAT